MKNKILAPRSPKRSRRGEVGWNVVNWKEVERRFEEVIAK